jgi:hypothetical protein
VLSRSLVLVVFRQSLARGPLLAALLVSSGCSSGGAEPEPKPVPTWLDQPTAELPPSMSELGLYRSLPALDVAHPAAVAFRPRYELWSNGADKQRYLVLPPGGAVDTSQPQAWTFPLGSLLFKTFSAPRETGAEPRAVETRVLWLQEQGWQYAVYLWDESGGDATLGDTSVTHPVSVVIDGERFEHVVPAKLDCRKCHESQAAAVIGFDELRLNAPYVDDQPTQLEALHAAGVLSTLPAAPDTIEHADAQARDVLGYLHGNCAHCHNGGDGASSAFDLRHPVAFENLIGRDTEGEALAGIRVVPGQPEQSVLWQALSRAQFDDIQPMPPVGVQRADLSALSLIHQWIETLPP